jgi:hypothetical protein
MTFPHCGQKRAPARTAAPHETHLREISGSIRTNDERGTLNDELKAACIQFIVQRSYFRVSFKSCASR